MRNTKFIFVTGGNLSSLGKGIASASIGRLMKARGHSVTLIKMDPYLNVDAGTMSPYQHGEVFVTVDGAETDLDLGHYERFIDSNLSRHHNITTGKVYLTVIQNERKGKYLGGTVQVIPHITDEIKQSIWRAVEASGAEIAVIEVGGTVGDIESGPFVEAIRQMRKDAGHENVMYVHLTYVPYLESSREQKTKLTQHSVKELRGMGIQPDMIIARCERPLMEPARAKISLFCDIAEEAVIVGQNTDLIYEIPLNFEKQGVGDFVARRLNCEPRPAQLDDWQEMVHRFRNPEGELTVAIVGKYVYLPDAYISLVEALRHAGTHIGRRIRIRWVSAEEIKDLTVANLLKEIHAVVVPGGFDARGIAGKIRAIQFCREEGVPFLGLCLGLQCAVIEFSRNVLGLSHANSTEFEPETPEPVIALVPSQRTVTQKGGTMRLGEYLCEILPGSLAARLYGATEVRERHRHRWEINNAYRTELANAGLRFSGVFPDEDLIEIIELAEHPFFLGTQFHPEFQSRPLHPHPLFTGFLSACLAEKRVVA